MNRTAIHLQCRGQIFLLQPGALCLLGHSLPQPPQFLLRTPAQEVVVFVHVDQDGDGNPTLFEDKVFLAPLRPFEQVGKMAACLRYPNTHPSR